MMDDSSVLASYQGAVDRDRRMSNKFLSHLHAQKGRHRAGSLLNAARVSVRTSGSSFLHASTTRRISGAIRRGVTVNTIKGLLVPDDLASRSPVEITSASPKVSFATVDERPDDFLVTKTGSKEGDDYASFSSSSASSKGQMGQSLQGSDKQQPRTSPPCKSDVRSPSSQQDDGGDLRCSSTNIRTLPTCTPCDNPVLNLLGAVIGGPSESPISSISSHSYSGRSGTGGQMLDNWLRQTVKFRTRIFSKGGRVATPILPTSLIELAKARKANEQADSDSSLSSSESDKDTKGRAGKKLTTGTVKAEPLSPSPRPTMAVSPRVTFKSSMAFGTVSPPNDSFRKRARTRALQVDDEGSKPSQTTGRVGIPCTGSDTQGPSKGFPEDLFGPAKPRARSPADKLRKTMVSTARLIPILQRSPECKSQEVISPTARGDYQSAAKSDAKQTESRVGIRRISSRRMGIAGLDANVKKEILLFDAHLKSADLAAGVSEKRARNASESTSGDVVLGLGSSGGREKPAMGLADDQPGSDGKAEQLQDAQQEVYLLQQHEPASGDFISGLDSNGGGKQPAKILVEDQPRSSEKTEQQGGTLNEQYPQQQDVPFEELASGLNSNEGGNATAGSLPDDQPRGGGKTDQASETQKENRQQHEPPINGLASGFDSSGEGTETTMSLVDEKLRCEEKTEQEGGKPNDQSTQLQTPAPGELVSGLEIGGGGQEPSMSPLNDQPRSGEKEGQQVGTLNEQYPQQHEPTCRDLMSGLDSSVHRKEAAVSLLDDQPRSSARNEQQGGTPNELCPQQHGSASGKLPLGLDSSGCGKRPAVSPVDDRPRREEKEEQQSETMNGRCPQQQVLPVGEETEETEENEETRGTRLPSEVSPTHSNDDMMTAERITRGGPLSEKPQNPSSTGERARATGDSPRQVGLRAYTLADFPQDVASHQMLQEQDIIERPPFPTGIASSTTPNLCSKSELEQQATDTHDSKRVLLSPVAASSPVGGITGESDMASEQQAASFPYPYTVPLSPLASASSTRGKDSDCGGNCPFHAVILAGTTRRDRRHESCHDKSVVESKSTALQSQTPAATIKAAPAEDLWRFNAPAMTTAMPACGGKAASSAMRSDSVSTCCGGISVRCNGNGKSSNRQLVPSDWRREAPAEAWRNLAARDPWSVRILTETAETIARARSMGKSKSLVQAGPPWKDCHSGASRAKAGWAPSAPQRRGADQGFSTGFQSKKSSAMPPVETTGSAPRDGACVDGPWGNYGTEWASSATKRSLPSTTKLSAVQDRWSFRIMAEASAALTSCGAVGGSRHFSLTRLFGVLPSIEDGDRRSKAPTTRIWLGGGAGSRSTSTNCRQRLSLPFAQERSRHSAVAAARDRWTVCGSGRLPELTTVVVLGSCAEGDSDSQLLVNRDRTAGDGGDEKGSPGLVSKKCPASVTYGNGKAAPLHGSSHRRLRKAGTSTGQSAMVPTRPSGRVRPLDRGGVSRAPLAGEQDPADGGPHGGGKDACIRFFCSGVEPASSHAGAAGDAAGVGSTSRSRMQRQSPTVAQERSGNSSIMASLRWLSCPWSDLSPPQLPLVVDFGSAPRGDSACGAKTGRDGMASTILTPRMQYGSAKTRFS